VPGFSRHSAVLQQTGARSYKIIPEKYLPQYPLRNMLPGTCFCKHKNELNTLQFIAPSSNFMQRGFWKSPSSHSKQRYGFLLGFDQGVKLCVTFFSKQSHMLPAFSNSLLIIIVVNGFKLNEFEVF